MRLNRFTRANLVKEFPFLSSIETNRGGSALEKAEAVAIRRLDENLLRRIPTTYRWDGSLVDIDRGSRFDFVLSDGTVLQDSVKDSGESGSNYAHSDRSEWAGESVAEAIDRHGVVESLRYVVEYRRGLRTIEHYSEGVDLIVYKPSKEDGLAKNVIARLYAEAKEEVEAESDF